MADEEKDKGATPPAGTETAPDKTPEKPPTETVESLQAEKDQLAKALKEANKESAARRKRLEELERLEDERRQAELSETEKLKAQLAEQQRKTEEAERGRMETVIKNAVITAAVALNFHDPLDAYSLLDLATLEVEDDGKVKGVDDALKALAKAKPYMLKTRTAPTLTPTSPGDGAGQGETEAQRRARIYGSGGGIFDPQTARAHGGGVFFEPDVNAKQRPKE